MAPDIKQNNSLSHVKDDIAITIKKMRKWIVFQNLFQIPLSICKVIYSFFWLKSLKQILVDISTKNQSQENWMLGLSTPLYHVSHIAVCAPPSPPPPSAKE